MWKVLNAIYYPHNKLGKGYLARTGEGVEIIQTRMPGGATQEILESAKVKLEKAKILRERLNSN
jgi:hypothetical protein